MQNKNIDMEMKNSKLRIIDTKVYERMLEKQSSNLIQSNSVVSAFLFILLHWKHQNLKFILAGNLF